MAADVPALSLTVWVALVVLALLMVRGAWRGYRRGPMRQLAGPVALATGQLVGWLFGSDLGHACLQGTAYPWVLRGFTGVIVLTCLTGLACYALFWRLGRQPEGQTEAESPVMGSLVGCWTGLLYFLICVAVLATVASVYDLFEKPGGTRHHWTVEVRNDL
ncbi:MAG: CvpA family protein, partial [Actinobacteria bacterium]|nr:CvpA family protein [Actinomycetota bacterium]